ncbi:DNA primase small subunit [Tribolium castaneum]|uniref:DNA primase n=1 Tax=Tribolium castaneum TaxID=7070 RepID=D6X0G8_TRICA|nr:PREDICTED: DNA primase small subunit isoform X2 [Tribolium castaneum]EFA09576.1 DNA primase small subunit-like Protein [Tribolium castaneum]|eukprot:XP_971054.2 PREDICTED: DNA primase small subunit isoform X2 [Tribolium castaneum]
MSASLYNEDSLPDLLPIYYKRLFPHTALHKWLCYGDPNVSNRREISFTLVGDIYLRYQSFENAEDFAQALHKRFPVKIDIGAIYKQRLESSGSYSSSKTPVEREIVFDIDMTDYDDVRTCCTGAGVCPKCWKFMVIACKILDGALREDFGFENILWVFSGRRGIHCWVADKKARILDDNQRSAIAEYLTLLRGGLVVRKVKFFNMHAATERALKVIDEYFEKSILVEQDILGTYERLDAFLGNIDEGFSPLFRDAMTKVQTSVERWKAFVNTFQTLQREQKIPKHYRYMVEEMKFYYAYPRLDINVTKSLNHLLKAPFCIHPKSGKVSVPFKPKFIEHFDPDAVPTVSQLLDEINTYDAKTKAQEKDLAENSQTSVKIKDYKKTSLLKYVTIFCEFLRGLQASAARNRAIKNGTVMEY